MQVILEAVLQTGTDKSIGQGYQEILLDKRRKSRGEDLLKHERIKGGWVEEELNTYAQKGDYSRVPFEIWDRRALD